MPMSDGSGTVNGMRFAVTEAAHHGDERTSLWACCSVNGTSSPGSFRASRTRS